MKREKLSVQDIRELKEGETKTFYVPVIRDLRTAQAIAYRLARFEPELGVSFTTTTNYDELSVTITAEKTK